MNNSIKHVSDIVFTPAVKALQSRMGSRSAYARMENGSGWQSIITKELKFFIEAQVSIFWQPQMQKVNHIFNIAVALRVFYGCWMSTRLRLLTLRETGSLLAKAI